ncbi:MAG: toll/interleukin-1 receptor domain-containing protein [Bacteroidaceae bacterium]|nr:toll/interleukin-1 receptor domain-containing protein [Bacteroidaceae bacterium]
MNIIKPKSYAPLELKQISQVFASKYTENREPNYFTGEDLVSFFNSFGFKDDYIFEDGGIIADDFENRPSRTQYTLARLRKLNDQKRVDEAIQGFINMAKDKEKAKHDLQVYIGEIITKTEHQQETAKIEEITFPEAPKAYKLSKESIFDNVPENNPVVFISYSWDDDNHKAWVKKLADELMSNGIYVFYDGYAPDGTDLVLFMRNGIKRADKVLIVGTPVYKEKLERNNGGAKFEDQIINATIYHDAGTTKFIPLLRKGNGFDESFSELIETRKGYDFRIDDNFDVEFIRLVKMLWGKSESKMPQLGAKPIFLEESCKEAVATTSGQDSWIKIREFRCFSNEESAKVSNQVISDIVEGKLRKPELLGNTIAILAFMMANDIIERNADIVTQLLEAVKTSENQILSKNDLYNFHLSFIQGINCLPSDNEIIVQFCKDYNDYHKEKYSLSKDKMTIALENLTDEIAEGLNQLDTEVWPDHSISYDMGPVFQYCDANTVVQALISLSNAGRTSVSRFIISHYKLAYYIQGEKDYCFIEDVPVLEDIIKGLESCLAEFKGNDKFAISSLIDRMKQAVLRCNGDRNSFIR